jgi:DNA-binding Lrp family transcriptional regulator
MDLRKLVEWLQVLGPRNISALAREVGHHPETVRYEVKKLARMGFSCRPVISYEKLGLRPIIAFVRLSKQLQGHENSFAKNLILYFYFPEERIPAFYEFMGALEGNGLVDSYKIFVTKKRVTLPFRPEFFDFQHATWSINWKELNSIYPLPITDKNKLCEFDWLDLKIVRALQKDPTVELTKLRNQLGKELTLKTVLYHYKSHVLSEGIISGYVVIWTGEPAISPAHRVLYPKIWLENLSYSEFSAALNTLSLLPFSWALFYTEDRDFIYTEALIPSYQLIEAAHWLTEQLDYSIASKLRIAFIDRNMASAFFFPDFMFDASSGEWIFDTDLAIKASLMLTEQVRTQK